MKLNSDFNGNQGASKRALVLTEHTGHFGWPCFWGTIYLQDLLYSKTWCWNILYILELFELWIVQLLAGYIVWGCLRNHNVNFIWISREKIMGFLFVASKHQQKELTITEVCLAQCSYTRFNLTTANPPSCLGTCQILDVTWCNIAILEYQEVCMNPYLYSTKKIRCHLKRDYFKRYIGLPAFFRGFALVFGGNAVLLWMGKASSKPAPVSCYRQPSYCLMAEIW